MSNCNKKLLLDVRIFFSINIFYILFILRNHHCSNGISRQHHLCRSSFQAQINGLLKDIQKFLTVPPLFVEFNFSVVIMLLPFTTVFLQNRVPWHLQNHSF